MSAKVILKDGRFAPFEEKIREISAFDILEKFEKDGAIENYRSVAAGKQGDHHGFPWFHGLICECITGISDLIGRTYNEALDRKLDDIIGEIAAAQRRDPEGWINPFTTLMRPRMRFGLNGGDALWQHEIYNAGCLFEAGVHHYRATGKTTLLSCAVKLANYYADRILDGPKWKVVCEHAVTEMALVELEELFQEEPALCEAVGGKPGAYALLAKTLIDNKGDHQGRHQFPPYLGEYAQDHRPARGQDEAVGHAVRATLFYAGMAAAARACDDAALLSASEKIWDNIVKTKLHISGGVGAFRDNERFGYQYDLPNNAYLETCAGVGLAFFGRELFSLKKDASIFDALELTFTNLIAASVSQDFTHYTYENPLESHGDYERWSWHDCPCCPPMLLKIVGAMPGFVMSCTGEDLYLNLHVDAEGTFGDVAADYAGGVLTLTGGKPMSIHVRIPDYAENFALLNGDGESVPYEEECGYAVVTLIPGEALRVEYDTPVRFVEAHPYVHADEGRAAVMRGAMLYALEGEGESFEAFDPELSKEAPELLENGRVRVRTTDGKALELIEYPSWNNNGKKLMRIWMRLSGKSVDPEKLEGWDGLLYRRF